MATSGSEVRGQLINFKVFEAEVHGVNLRTGEISIIRSSGTSASTGASEPEIIPPLYFGGVSDAGFYQHPEVGDKILCTRVHPGSHGVTQALRVIPGANRHRRSTEVPPTATVPAGRGGYPIGGLRPGDIKIVSSGGGELSLRGGVSSNSDRIANTSVFLGNYLRSGLHIINSNAQKTNVTVVGHSIQSVSSGGRLICGDAVRIPEGVTVEGAAASCGHQLLTYVNDIGITRGIWPGDEASTSSFMNQPRNPPLSEYRLVINEISEHSVFKGWDIEPGRLGETVPQQFSTESDLRAIGPVNVLHLAPHQLIEIVGGNVINKRGELLDPNYGVVKIGDANGRPPSRSVETKYEEARRISRRSIGYHFQLSTNSMSTDVSNDVDNFIMAIDKEGALKVSVPKSSNTGNVLYPTHAEFYNNQTNSVSTSPSGFRAKEKIPVTLRNKNSDVVFPSETAADSVLSDGEAILRHTGVRHTNEDNYFQGLDEVSAGDGKNVRVHSTKYHNMYAAAEMLIANRIEKVMIPFENHVCTGYIPGNSIGESFERKAKDISGDGSDETEVKFMAAVGISPARPVMDAGGGVFIAGQDKTLDTDEAGDRINYQYTNSFTVSKSDDDALTATNADKVGGPRRDPGGKSANLNFEGSIEASIGQDNFDKKSIVLDTAGSLIAWFGKDLSGRSVVLQTDGEVLLNIGGTDGDTFNQGRFDLRVNVTDKGFMGEEQTESTGNASDYIISISENGLVIAGMKPGTPMIIRNDGDLCVESTAKLILAGQTVEVREGNRPPRKTHKDPASTDTPEANAEGAVETIECILKALEDLTE